MLEHFAKSAEGVGQFRLAQTWRILSYTMGLLLTRRAEYHRERRLAWQDEKRLQQEKEEKKAMKDNKRQSEQYLQEELTPRKLERPKSPVEGFANPSMKSILTEEIESSSNMTTPQARPVRDSMIVDPAIAAPTSTIDIDRLELTPATQSFSASPMKIPERSHREEEPASSVDGYDFYDMDSVTTPAIDIAAPQRRAPLRLDLHLRDPGGYPKLAVWLVMIQMRASKCFLLLVIRVQGNIQAPRKAAVTPAYRKHHLFGPCPMSTQAGIAVRHRRIHVEREVLSTKISKIRELTMNTLIRQSFRGCHRLYASRKPHLMVLISSTMATMMWKIYPMYHQ